MVDHSEKLGITRQRVRVSDLQPIDGYPVDRFQPNGLPKLRATGLSDAEISKLQGPAVMLDI
jgi:hypothetical protein